MGQSGDQTKYRVPVSASVHGTIDDPHLINQQTRP